MNMRREAILWSIAIAAAVALGLAVIWTSIALAFSQPNLAPLYFAAAPYSQDDYSAEGVDTARLNPLDPGLVQEAIVEDQARASLVPIVNHQGLAAQSSQTATPPASADISVPVPADTPQPVPTDIPQLVPTDTPMPVPTNTPVAPQPTHTPRPTHTPKLPALTSTPQPTPANTSQPAPTNTSVAPQPTRTPKPTHTPKSP